MKVFVVTKTYDWGNYGSGSENVKIFASLDKAKEYCENKNLVAQGLYDYEFDWEEVEFEE